MLFNSPQFLLFFPITTVGWFALRGRARISWMLAASALFYMAFVPKYLLILAFTIVVDYAAGIMIEAARGRRRFWWLLASLGANIGVLVVFKYWNFLGANVGWISTSLGFANPVPVLDIVLPIGLSFHTFQAMSYTIEVYRGNQPAERDFLVYSLYVMYFPQLVAGPIERPQNLLGQLRADHRFDHDRAVSGLLNMAAGMFQKVVVADRLAELGGATGAWKDPAHTPGPLLGLAILAFTFQIYNDFSGYSRIAIGASRVLGVELTSNFAAPYQATSISEFWGRWHISLSTWFRSYVYFPLGGSRRGARRHYANLAIVFCISGLWHGASWTYVVWGFLHALFLIAEDLGVRMQRRLGLPALPRAVAWGLTFSAVSLCWVFFRSPDLATALSVLGHLDHGWTTREVANLRLGASAAFLVLLVSFYDRLDHEKPMIERLRRGPAALRYAVYLGLIYGALFLLPNKGAEFIYFQF
jgi:alginate O-acetyltransferase complex protein AlgI